MALRKNTSNRKILFRECYICGRTFTTTASTPWLRQLPRDGKRQCNTYFCSQTCYEKSFKHIFDGKARERRKKREAEEDRSEKNHRYYERHAEEIRAKKKEWYWRNLEEAKRINQYNKAKMKARLANSSSC